MKDAFHNIRKKDSFPFIILFIIKKQMVRNKKSSVLLFQSVYVKNISEMKFRQMQMEKWSVPTEASRNYTETV